MSKTKKAVILARGLGTRMRKSSGDAKMSDEQASVAAKGIKALIPIKRPFLDYVMHNLIEAGFTDVCLVIGDEHQAIRDYYGRDAGLSKIRVHYAVQKEPKGTADAVAAAEEFAGDDSFIVINSDNYYPLDGFKALNSDDGTGLVAYDKQVMIEESNVAVERLMGYAIVETDANGSMVAIHEKPSQEVMDSFGKHALLSMNCWRFTKSIFEACRNISPSPRGEYEITDAVNYDILKLGKSYHVYGCTQPVLDLSCQDDIASVAEHIGDLEVSL
ncbi:nucleotidyltransferase family protein [Planctomycetota bacterium]|nr:nucleotidyltransferase family protein [Planctomycetota bacterium]